MGAEQRTERERFEALVDLARAQHAARVEKAVSSLTVGAAVRFEIMSEPDYRNAASFYLIRKWDESKAKVAALEAENARLRAYIASDAQCPCCGRSDKCASDCTFLQDDGDACAAMEHARAVLAAQEPRDAR